LILRLWMVLCAGLFAVCAAPEAFAQTTTYSDTTTTAGGAISDTTTPCATPLVRNFSVGTSYIVGDVDIGVILSHTYRSDLRMTLQSPAGTRVQFFSNTGGAADNYNVMINDEASPSVSTDASNHVAGAPNYPNNFSAASPTGTTAPNTPLSAFDGQNAAGTWRLEICDSVAQDSGDFVRADLVITQAAPYADLSLTKTVSTATPANGATITYTLAVTNAAASPLTANSVTVNDVLPLGVTFVSATGFGTYNNSTGVWTVGSIPPGTTRTLTITATVNASNGATVNNTAEVSASSANDIDSTPNNGLTTEDDYASAAFTVSGTRVAGTAPALVCPVGSTLFDWAANTWTAGSLNNSFTPPSIGQFNIGITTDVAFVAGSPAINGNLNGGIVGETGLFLNMNNNVVADASRTVITLPGAVPALQFRLFDVDFGAASFADKVTVTGSFNGSAVTPILTNGVSNYVVGNVAIGDAGAGDTTADGTVVVSFTSPVDTLTITYGNHTTGPANPGNQWMSIHDITLCNPQVALGLTKVSAVYNDGVAPQFFIPGNDASYTIALSNTGSGSPATDTVFMLDPLPSQVTFFNGDANGPSTAGTDPVLFVDNGSGLTFNYATDVRYATTAPANFAACTYTPTAGYDANVRYVCVNPKGRMKGKSGAATPSFSVSFRARIN
jgi:uncharacterized repeat protein (TIGR01451 family)